MRKPHSLDFLKNEVKNINSNINILDSISNKNGGNRIIVCECLIDGHTWNTRWSHIKRGHGCPMCAGQIVSDKNSMKKIRPDLIKYLENKEDADKYSYSSSKTINLICPSCNSKRSMPINILAKHGFSCKVCSDGISVPEKFIINLFKQLEVDFNRQKSFSWSDRKLYDFFAKDTIIEANGIQHYEESPRGRSLKEEQENDLLKYNLAIQNGIKPENYIIIDARYSKFEWLKENCIKELSGIYNLSQIDWNLIWEESQKSILFDICDYWNNKTDSENTTTVANVFGINRNTIRKYLKIGNELKLCEYDPYDEHVKWASKSGKKRGIPVFQYDLNWNFIKSYADATQAQKETGANRISISRCCNKKQETSKKFRWSFEYLDSEDGIIKQEKKETKF